MLFTRRPPSVGKSNKVVTTNGSLQSIAARGGGLAMSGGTLRVAGRLVPQATSSGHAIGVPLSLYSADGTWIASTVTDPFGNYQFNSTFSGLGYIQMTRVATFDLAPLGSVGLDGRVSAIDPSTLRSETVTFLSGTPLGRHLDVILKPVQTELVTGKNWVLLVRIDNQAVLWRTQIKPNGYKGGFTVATVDFNFDNTIDFVLLPREGKARPIFVEGRSGAATEMTRAVARELRDGFVVQAFNFTGTNMSSEWILSPSHNRSGRVSLVDLRANLTKWTAHDTVVGKTRVSSIISAKRGGESTPSVVLTSMNRQFYKSMKALDGSTGKLIRVDDRLAGSAKLKRHWARLFQGVMPRPHTNTDDQRTHSD